MALKQAKRGNVSSFLVMDVMRAAAEIEATGKGILHLEVGQPGFQAPKGHASQPLARLKKILWVIPMP